MTTVLYCDFVIICPRSSHPGTEQKNRCRCHTLLSARFIIQMTVLVVTNYVSLQVPKTAKLAHTQCALVVTYARVLSDVTSTVSGRDKPLATELTRVRIVSAVDGLVLMQPVCPGKAPTTQGTRVFTGSLDDRAPVRVVTGCCGLETQTHTQLGESQRKLHATFSRPKAHLGLESSSSHQ